MLLLLALAASFPQTSEAMRPGARPERVTTTCMSAEAIGTTASGEPAVEGYAYDRGLAFCDGAGVGRHGEDRRRDPNGYQDSVNQYAYGANDPIDHRDPTGEAGEPGERTAGIFTGLEMSEEHSEQLVEAELYRCQTLWGFSREVCATIPSDYGSGAAVGSALKGLTPADIQNAVAAHVDTVKGVLGAAGLKSVAAIVPIVPRARTAGDQAWRDLLASVLSDEQALNERATELNELRRGREPELGTTAVIRGRHKTTGEVRDFVAVEAPRVPKSVRSVLRQGEEAVDGLGHAEETIFAKRGGEYDFLAGGTSRNVCVGICAPLAQKHGLELTGPRFRGKADKTPFRLMRRK